MGLEVKNLSKSFGDNKAVNDLSFEMNEPEIFGLLGTNGAGKTTAIRIILGIMQKDAGIALWNGNEISRKTVKFGYMPEERGIYPKIKVIEQLVYFGQLRGLSKGDAYSSAKKWLDELGVIEYINTYAERLSKGNQQKIQLIATLIHNPDLIFLDEPFSGLDPINTDIFKNVIKNLVDQGKYIIMSSHQMFIIEEYCKDLVILDKGITKLEGNLRKIKAGYGHTNLTVESEVNISDIAIKHNLKFIRNTGNNFEFKISGDEQAESFIKDLVKKDIIPIKYEIREPSLHEIFIEKVGGEA